jgi:hypothetical protein
MSSQAQLRSLRWILFAVMVLTAVLVAVAGRPLAPADSAPGNGFIGTSQQGSFPAPLGH